MSAKKPTHQLTDLVLHEGSLVDKGDNPEAHIRIAKAGGPFAKLWRWVHAAIRKDEPALPAPKTTAEVMAADQFAQDFARLKCAFIDSIYSILDVAPSSNMVALLQRSVDEFAAKAQSTLGHMPSDVSAAIAELKGACGDMESVEKRFAFVTAVQKIDVLEPTGPVPALPAAKADEVEKMKTLDEVMAALSPEDKAVVEAALQANQEKPAEEKPAEKPAAEKPAEVEMAKAAPVVDVEKADLAKRLEDATNELAKLKDEKVTAEFVKRATEIGLPGQDAAHVGGLLKRAYAASKQLGDDVDAALKSAATHAAAVTAPLFAKVGTPGGDSAGATASSKIANLADELRKQNPKLSKHQAEAKVLEQNPALYKQSLAEAGQ